MEYVINIGLYELIPLSILLFSKLKPKKICVFTFWVLFLFSALSYDVGWDYIPYLNDIKNLNIERHEFLEKQLMALSFNLDFYQLFFIVNHLLILLCVLYTIKNESRCITLSIIVFICFPFMFLTGLSTIRSALATAIIFWATGKFLKDKRILLYLVVVLICFFIHKSSILSLLILFFYYIPLNRWGNLVLLVTAFLVGGMGIIPSFNNFFFFNNELLSDVVERYDRYVQGGGDTGSQQLVQIIFVGINIMNIIFYKSIGKTDIIRKYITLINIGCCLFFVFRGNTVLASRFSRLFYLFVVLVIPYYIDIIKIGRKNAVGLIVGVCLIIFVYQLYVPNYNGMDPWRINTYWPYKFFFLQ